MKFRPNRIIITILTLFFLLWHTQETHLEAGKISLSTTEQLAAEFENVPCANEDRLDAVRTLFQKMGASPAEMTIDRHGKVKNLVVCKPGATAETIVIGAHYDKAGPGCGAVDNWTGIVILAHLYQSLKSQPLRKTLLFVAFDQEEKGLVGSKAMVSHLSQEEVKRSCEMVNLDSFGLGAPQVADNMSHPELTLFVAELARKMKLPFAHVPIPNANSDSSSFLKRNIPALTLHGMSDEWISILHTKNDQPEKINHRSVYLGYRLALALLVQLDELPCGKFK
ncbi:MAG: Zn-dependent exopeptidase M28 [Blastocatellia bacterium]|nr:Zn-dependent exopeptidase M28 [Blastocatellia bacterium]